MEEKEYYVGRGCLHPEKLAEAEKLRGKPLVGEDGITEIRLCPYVYHCSLVGEMGWGKMRREEHPVRDSWVEDGILTLDSFPVFTQKGAKFVEFVLKWAYPEEYARMVILGRV